MYCNECGKILKQQIAICLECKAEFHENCTNSFQKDADGKRRFCRKCFQKIKESTLSNTSTLSPKQLDSEILNRKLQDINEEMLRIIAAMAYLKKENLKLKENSETLKSSINKIICVDKRTRVRNRSLVKKKPIPGESDVEETYPITFRNQRYCEENCSPIIRQQTPRVFNANETSELFFNKKAYLDTCTGSCCLQEELSVTENGVSVYSQKTSRESVADGMCPTSFSSCCGSTYLTECESEAYWKIYPRQKFQKTNEIPDNRDIYSKAASYTQIGSRKEETYAEPTIEKLCYVRENLVLNKVERKNEPWKKAAAQCEEKNSLAENEINKAENRLRNREEIVSCRCPLGDISGYLTSDSEKDGLKILSVDSCFKRNGVTHRTGMFELMTRDVKPQLVVRRGQPFILQLQLNRPYNQATDFISFIFKHKLANYPSIGRKTLVVIPLVHSEELSPTSTKWGAVFDGSEGNMVSVFIIPAANTIIGQWKLAIDTEVKRQGADSFNYKGVIYVLFNAWCKEDDVYIDLAANRKEYVLTEVGMIWKGTHKRPVSSLWKYGQFDEDILDCSLMLLDHVAKLPLTQYSNPIMVARGISAAVNSPDDNGVIIGNWSEDFSGGKKPSEWIGSPKILRKFYKTRKPVKYGQCYVFAGVATTVFRALGIPSRCVTCYKSAHDYGCSLTLDRFINDEGEYLDEFSRDVIWNYHVWNEIWTKRPDLDAQYNGWQVVDGTPQELSDNLYRCGPAPVVAVKNGDILKPYDVGYVFSEVNADIIYWRYQGLTQPLKLIQTDTEGIGHFISTKAVGEFKREDLTNNYKHQEKSNEERLVMLSALKKNESLYSRYYLNESFNDVKFEFQLQDDIVIGSTFSIYLSAKNVSQTDHTVNVVLRSATQNNNGEIVSIIKREEEKMVINAASERKMGMELSYQDYAPFIKDDYIYHICALCKVDGTEYEYFAQDDFKITMPTLTIKLEGEPVANTVLYGTVFFMNPLPEKLKNCVYLIEGPGIKKGLKYKIDDVPPCGMAKVNFKMIPTFYGKQTIVAKFNSNKLNNIDGYLTINVGEGGNKESNNVIN